MRAPVTAFNLTPLLNNESLRKYALSLLVKGTAAVKNNSWDQLNLIALPARAANGSTIPQITLVTSGRAGGEFHKVSVVMTARELPREVMELFIARCPAILNSSSKDISESTDLLAEVMPSCAGMLIVTPSLVTSGEKSSFTQLAYDLVDDPQQDGTSIAMPVDKIPDDFKSLLQKVHLKNWQTNLFDQLRINADEIIFCSQIQECQLDGQWASLSSKVFIDEYRDSRFGRGNRTILLSLKEPFEEVLRPRTMGSVIVKLTHAIAFRELLEAVHANETLQSLLRHPTFKEIYAASRQKDALLALDCLVKKQDSLDIDRGEVERALKQISTIPQFPTLAELISRAT